MAGINWYAAYTLNKKSCMTKPVPLCSLTNLQLRFLCPTDLEEVRALCQDWFPIDYPYSWYEDITSNPRFYSLAAVYNGTIIGLIVAEIKSYVKLNKEDRGILSQSFSSETEVGYILSLGVSKAHRRNGIASLLLDNLISHLTTIEHVDCKAVFLHVLTTNSPAIHFYEHRNFRLLELGNSQVVAGRALGKQINVSVVEDRIRDHVFEWVNNTTQEEGRRSCSFKLHSFLPYYYSIKGKCKDGFTYVLYINGGHPPWGVYIMARIEPCSLPFWLWHKIKAAVHWIWPGLHNATTTFFSYS